MPRYSVTGAVHASTFIGEYDANTPWEAIERAYRDAGISLCHECAREVSDPEVCELVAEDMETGDATSEATTNDQIVEQAAEIRQLRKALRLVVTEMEEMDRCDATRLDGRATQALMRAQAVLDGVKEKP